MPSARSRIGRSAEILAAAELGKRGYRIIASNWHCRCGEIDLIAQDGDMLVFVEVRCKRTTTYGTAAESVTPAKQHKIALTAEEYLRREDLDGKVNCRFDVVTVEPVDGRLTVTDVIRDAFTL